MSCQTIAEKIDNIKSCIRSIGSNLDDEAVEVRERIDTLKRCLSKIERELEKHNARNNTRASSSKASRNGIASRPT